jgi:hypothetical protein
MSKKPRLGAATCSALSWKSPDSAPKDGATQILGDFGYPWPQLAVYNLYNDQWCVVEMACSPMQDGPMDTWFETDTQNHDQLRRWMPMPKLPKRKPNKHIDGSSQNEPR